MFSYYQKNYKLSKDLLPKKLKGFLP